jgi:hypothetical protein
MRDVVAQARSSRAIQLSALTARACVRYDFLTVMRIREGSKRSAAMTLLVAGSLWSAWFVVLAQARAGDVHGQLILGSTPATELPKPPRAACNWELENGVKEVLPVRVNAARELAVVLLGAGDPKTDHVEVAVSGGELLPATLALRSGTTLRIHNED